METTKTIQQFRHEARGVLRKAREDLRLRTEGTGEVYSLINGTIDSLLAGQPGYSKDQQVAHLIEARETALVNKALLAEAVAKAKAEVIAMVEAWDFEPVLDEVAAVLTEAAKVAEARDFEAHQSEKAALKGLDFAADEEADEVY